MKKITLSLTTLALVASFGSSTAFAQSFGKAIKKDTVSERSGRSQRAERRERRGIRARTSEGAALDFNTAFARRFAENMQKTMGFEGLRFTQKELQRNLGKAEVSILASWGQSERVAFHSLLDAVTRSRPGEKIQATVYYDNLSLAAAVTGFYTIAGKNINYDQGEIPAPKPSEAMYVMRSGKNGKGWNPRAKRMFTKAYKYATQILIENPNLHPSEAFKRAVERLDQESPGFKDAYKENCRGGKIAA